MLKKKGGGFFLSLTSDPLCEEDHSHGQRDQAEEGQEEADGRREGKHGQRGETEKKSSWSFPKKKIFSFRLFRLAAAVKEQLCFLFFFTVAHRDQPLSRVTNVSVIRV